MESNRSAFLFLGQKRLQLSKNKIYLHLYNYEISHDRLLRRLYHERRDKIIPKFRAWDKINNRFVRISDFVIDPDGSSKEIGTEFLDFGIDPSFDKVALMQSTGLKDKNDVEIFEGIFAHVMMV